MSEFWSWKLHERSLCRFVYVCVCVCKPLSICLHTRNLAFWSKGSNRINTRFKNKYWDQFIKLNTGRWWPLHDHDLSSMIETRTKKINRGQVPSTAMLLLLLLLRWQQQQRRNLLHDVNFLFQCLFFFCGVGFKYISFTCLSHKTVTVLGDRLDVCFYYICMSVVWDLQLFAWVILFE